VVAGGSVLLFRRMVQRTLDAGNHEEFVKPERGSAEPDGRTAGDGGSPVGARYKILTSF
jgi:hypothetical protein